MDPSVSSTDLLDSLGYAYFELDLSGRLTYGNKTFFRTLGYERDELMGKHFRRYVDRSKVHLMFNIFAMIHKTGMVEKKLLMDFMRKDGSYHTAEGSVALIRDENGEAIGFRSVLLDVTERRQRETTIIRAKKQAERELEIAREIQFSFLVQDYPQPEGWEIATHIRPARQVSGDFYDVFQVASTNQIALIIADVCDKGVGAAMYMAIFRSLLRAYSAQHYTARREPGVQSLQHTIELTNNYIATHHGKSNMFATVFFGLLEPESGELLYINAGHEAPIVISRGQVHRRLDPTGPAVGMLPDMEFQVEQLTLAPGDGLLLYTDGITDARSRKEEPFAEHRLVEAATSPTATAQGRIQNILSAIDKHIAGREQYDDVTLVALQRKESSL